MNGLEEIKNPISCTFNKTTGVKKYEYTETQVNAIEKELEEKVKQDIIINAIKEVIEFNIYEPKFEKTEECLSFTQQIVWKQRRELTKKELETYRSFILNQCFPKELKALEIIKTDRDLCKFIIFRLEQNHTKKETESLKEVLL